MALRQEKDIQPIERLSDLHEGECARIIGIDATGPLRRRLMEMGFLPGTIIYLERVGLLGDPASFLIRGYHISLRRQEAQTIRAEHCACEQCNRPRWGRHRFRGGD